MRSTSLVLFATACALLAAPLARAELPLPTYPDCGATPDLAGCPSDAGDWTLWNFTPSELLGVIDAEEEELGIGNAVLPAWQVCTGRWQEVVAIADSGILWQTGGLARKVFLNVGELPPPQDANGVAAAVHDRDGNGLVNLDDYALDPRVLMTGGDDAADHLLDPSDLLAAFSDGVDDDANGYPDDIAGWDFFEGDNNAFATNSTNYGDHGTGVLRDAGEEGGDGSGIGVCPNCAVLPIRVGDSFVTTGAHIAQAIVFASEHRAVTIGMALGGMTDHAFVRAAIDVAWERGLLVVAAAGDETSFHRNWPSSNARVLSVHSIGATGRDDWESSSSFLRFVNCNNFGGRVDLVAVTGNTCATGAVARIAGAVGLLQSAAVEQLGERLSPGAIATLLETTAVDIDLPGSRGPDADPVLYPTFPGWDQFSGHGRMDLGAAMAALVGGGLPPVVELTSPPWFSLHRQEDYTDGPDGVGVLSGGAGLPIRGRVAPGAGADVTWRLEWAAGVDVEDAAWNVLAEGSGASGLDAELGALAIGQRWARGTAPPAAGCGEDTDEEEGHSYVLEGDPLADGGYDAAYVARAIRDADTVTGRSELLDPYRLTLRLVATDGAGRRSEDRREISVRRDALLLPGFPQDLGSSLEASPLLVDLDGDRVFEIVQAASDGTVYALNGRGQAMPGWPRTVGPLPNFDPANPTNHLGAAAYAGGSINPLTLRQNIVGAPAAADLDGDGVVEVVVTTLSGRVYVWDAGGALRPGFPVSIDPARCDAADRDDDHRTDCGIFGTPALADLDGDGRLDIVVGAMDQHVYVWDAAGALLPGFPAFVQAGDSLPDAQDEVARIVSSPAVGDLDGDGDLEIVIGTGQTAGSDFAGYGLLYVLDRTGAVWPGWPVAIFAGFAGALPYIGEGVVVSPVLADLDADGDLEIVANAIADPGTVYHHDGSKYGRMSSTVGDFAVGSNANEASALMMVANPALADLDDDGVPDVIVGGSGIGYGLNIAAWSRRFEHQHLLMAYSGALVEGRLRALPGYPRVVEDMQFFVSSAAADLDGDGALEVIHGTTDLTRVFSLGGSEPLGPFWSNGWQMGAPAVGDVDGDGLLDLVTVTREGWMQVWRTPGRADGRVEWPQFRHDARRTGNWHVGLPTQAGPVVPPVVPPGDAACALPGRAPGGQIGLLLLGLALLARRRR